MIIKWIVGFFSALNSNQRPGEVAGGIAFAFLLALMPPGNLLWMAVFTLTFFLKINSGMMTVFLLIFKIFAWLLDPLLHVIGYQVLTMPALNAFFAGLYNAPLMPFTKFNNTIVLGGFILGVVLWIPVFILFNILVRFYRDKLADKLRNSKLVQFFMKIPVLSSIINIVSKAVTMFSKAN